MAQSTREKYGLPSRPFLYTLDQMVDILRYSSEKELVKSVYFENRSVGPCPKEKMLARNIAGPDDSPEWRVEEDEFIRWMRVHKIVPMTRKSRY